MGCIITWAFLCFFDSGDDFHSAEDFAEDLPGRVRSESRIGDVRRGDHLAKV
jgi:hypothetical protein